MEKEKILIIDDSIIPAAKLQIILKDEYDVTIVQTASEGIQQARTGAYSLILLDVIMPEMDGFTVLKHLLETPEAQNVPVIFITSRDTTEDECRGLLLGAVDYIKKPFQEPIVKARVNAHVKLYTYRKQIELQSSTDQLTGLANRRRYDHYSAAKWQEAIRLQIPFSVCIFDIDCFKSYNDTFGHPAGDKVLATVADVLARSLRRTTDFVARYGGEEFVAIVLGETSQQVFEYIKRIRSAVEALQIPHAPSPFQHVTISGGGITVIPRAGEEYASHLKIADNMLYEAKRSGRNQIVWCSVAMEQWREREAKGDEG